MTLLAFSFAEYFKGWSVLPVIFFIVGVVLLVIEMITPGFGAPGILGALSLVAAVIVQARTFTDALIDVLVIIVVLGIAAVIVFRSFDKGRISKTPIVLDEETPSAASDNTELIGKKGIVINDLRPSGFAEIEGRKYDVVTSGEFITKGMHIEVTATEGQKIIVKKADK